MKTCDSPGICWSCNEVMRCRPLKPVCSWKGFTVLSCFVNTDNERSSPQEKCCWSRKSHTDYDTSCLVIRLDALINDLLNICHILCDRVTWAFSSLFYKALNDLDLIESVEVICVSETTTAAANFWDLFTVGFATEANFMRFYHLQ